MITNNRQTPLVFIFLAGCRLVPNVLIIRGCASRSWVTKKSINEIDADHVND